MTDISVERSFPSFDAILEVTAAAAPRPEIVAARRLSQLAPAGRRHVDLRQRDPRRCIDAARALSRA